MSQDATPLGGEPGPTDHWASLRLDEVKRWAIGKGATPTSPLVRDIELVAHTLATLRQQLEEARGERDAEREERAKFEEDCRLHISDKLKLLAALSSLREDAERLLGLEQFACAITTRTGDGYEEKYERGSDDDEPFRDWLDFVIANTTANHEDERSGSPARSTPEGADGG